MIIENEKTEKVINDAFDSCFDFEEVPLEDYSKDEITMDIKQAIKQGIINYINSN